MGECSLPHFQNFFDHRTLCLLEHPMGPLVDCTLEKRISWMKKIVERSKGDPNSTECQVDSQPAPVSQIDWAKLVDKSLEWTFPGKFQAETSDFLSLNGKLNSEHLSSLAPALRLSDSRWEATIWRLNRMACLTNSPEGFISICNQTVVTNSAAFTVSLSSSHLEGAPWGEQTHVSEQMKLLQLQHEQEVTVTSSTYYCSDFLRGV